VARVCFTQNLTRQVACPDEDVSGTTVREVLDSYFARNPDARSYVLDEHGAMRSHVVIFVGDSRATDRLGLADPVPPEAEVLVTQALSGG
jgi:hypothetical protein